MKITLNKPHALKVGDKVTLYTDNEEFEKKVVNVESETSFSVDNWEKKIPQIFVYGKEVNDFRAIDYDRIFTLGISAIQELSKENEQLKSELQTLREEIAQIKTIMANGGMK